MISLETDFDSTGQQESVCLVLAIGIHALLLFLNPVILTSNYKPVHDFVTIDVVEQPAPGGGDQAPEPPKKMSMMDTLKDMLMKPKTEDIAHVAPEPLTHRVAAPMQPALQEKSMPHSIASMFQPKSQSEDLAATSAPNTIQTQAKNFTMPTSGPTLQSKALAASKPETCLSRWEPIRISLAATILQSFLWLSEITQLNLPSVMRRLAFRMPANTWAFNLPALRVPPAMSMPWAEAVLPRFNSRVPAAQATLPREPRAVPSFKTVRVPAAEA